MVCSYWEISKICNVKEINDICSVSIARLNRDNLIAELSAFSRFRLALHFICKFTANSIAFY